MVTYALFSPNVTSLHYSIILLINQVIVLWEEKHSIPFSWWQSRMFLCRSKYFQEHHSSLAARQKDLKKFVTPAPGMYEVRLGSSAFWFCKNIASNFQAVDMTQYKSKSPVFSLGQRFNPPADRFSQNQTCLTIMNKFWYFTFVAS